MEFFLYICKILITNIRYNYLQLQMSETIYCKMHFKIFLRGQGMTNLRIIFFFFFFYSIFENEVEVASIEH